MLALELRCASRWPVISTSTAGGPWFGLALLGESFGLLAQLLYGACERLLGELAVQRMVDDHQRTLALDRHPGRAGLVDIQLVEADRRPAVGVTVDRLVKLLDLRQLLVAFLPSVSSPTSLVFRCVGEAENALAPDFLSTPADHPADLALQPADDPLAAAGNVGNKLLQDLRAGLPDLPQLLDARQRDHAVADQFLRADR